MDKSDKKRIKERRKRLKKQRRDYIRGEKESLKRQRTELNKKYRRRSKSGIKRLIHSLFLSRKKENKPRVKRPKLSWRKKFNYFLEELRNRKKTRKKIARKRHESKRLRAKFTREERKSLKEEKRKKRIKLAPMRRRIRSDRNQYWKSKIIDFLKHPVKVKKRSKEEQLLRKHIRQDIREQRKRTFFGIPGMIGGGFANNFSKRIKKIRYSIAGVRKSMEKFGGVWRTREYRSDLFKTFVNSTSLFLFAYFVTYYINQLVTLSTALYFEIPSELFSYRIFWPLYTYSSLYSRQALILIFGTGPLATLILAILAYRVFLLTKKINRNFKILLLWIIFHGLNFFFGAYISGVITRTGFVYTTEWIFLSTVFDTEEIAFVILSAIALLSAGIYSTKLHIMAVTSRNMIEPKVRLYLVLSQVLFPGITGALVLFFLNYPSNPPELLMLYAISFLMLFPVLTNYNSPSNLNIKKYLKTNRVKTAWIYIILTIMMLIFIRLVIFEGVSFS
ncbi:MAG: hypothetical protein K8S16_17340 [Bacteroidales bacterium]|nr:hypothetical protein [Bacteroidales bacterium]